MEIKERNKGKCIVEFPSDYTVVDIETTGLSPGKCEIIEISALKVRNDKIIKSFSSLVKPSKKIDSFIMNLTGITNDMVVAAPKIKTVLPDFMEFVENDFILGHNVNFDINFIYDNLKKYYKKDFKNDFVDTMRLSRIHCNLKKHNLKTLAKYYNISLQGHHRALVDCEITYNVYMNIKKEAAAKGENCTIKQITTSQLEMLH